MGAPRLWKVNLPMALLHFLQRRLGQRHGWLLAIGAGLLLSLASVFGGFATDDHNFRLLFQGAPGAQELARPPWEVFSFFLDRGPEQRAAMIERGVLPWWTGDTFHGGFFRPITSLSHYLDWQLFGEHAWPMHLHNLAIFAAMLFGLGLLYRRQLAPPWIAALALLLYAIDDARGMNVGWLSGRNTLLSAAFGVWAILMHDLWRRDGWKPGMVLGPLLWLFGLGSAEAGLGAAGYLAAYMLTLEKGAWWRRPLTMLPYAPAFLIWAITYKAMGYGVHGSNGYIDPFNDPVMYCKGMLIHLPVQLFGEFGVPDSVFFNVLPWPGNAVYWVLAAAYLTLLFVLAWPILKASAPARFFAVGMVLSLLPASATLPQDRLLTLASVGGAPIIALLLERLLALLPVQRTRLAGFAFYALIVLHLLLPCVTFPITSASTGLMEQANQIADHSLPMQPEVAGETVIIANAPTELMCVAVPIVRSSLREPVPAHTLLLSVGNDTVSVDYVDPHTILVHSEGESLNTPWANLFRRTSTEPLRAGWTRELSNVRIEVVEAAPEGSPRLTKFTFKEPLDSAKLHWLTWAGDRYVPFTLPGLGERMELAARPFVPVGKSEFRPVRAEAGERLHKELAQTAQ